MRSDSGSIAASQRSAVVRSALSAIPEAMAMHMRRENDSLVEAVAIC